MKITINNTFHSTSVNMTIKDDSLSLTEYQVKRAQRELCFDGCSCGSMWSYNHTEVEGYEGCHFEPLIDSSGNANGAELVQN
jgi:hypothetical protein